MSRLHVAVERWPLTRPFRTAMHVNEDMALIHVRVERGGLTGHGEAIGVSYRGETVESMTAQIEAVRGRIEAGADRQALQVLLPPGGARNALDCALWDLACKGEGRSIWDLTGLTPAPVTTTYTLSIDTPEAMAAHAAAAPSTHLKLKLHKDRPVDCVRAVRAVRPDAHLIVDANQAWDLAMLETVAPAMADLGVHLIEQPLPAGADGELADFQSPIPLCADESCQTAHDLDVLPAGYSVINIKLDKTGGLTAALDLARAAQARGYNLMVGCMTGTSLSMAPGFVVAQLCRFVDLDGPLLFAKDRSPAITYEYGRMDPPPSGLWGGAG